MEITLSIKGQELRVLGKQPNLYHGSIGVLYIKFCDVNFDNSLVKTVRFKTDESDWYTADIIDGRVRVPHDVIVVGGFDVAVGGYDTKEGELQRFLPTNSVHIDILENGYGEPDAPLIVEGECESVIAKLEKKADIDYVKKFIPQKTLKGEIIEIFDHTEGEDAINCRIYGNSVQETRSGKNLFNKHNNFDVVRNNYQPYLHVENDTVEINARGSGTTLMGAWIIPTNEEREFVISAKQIKITEDAVVHIRESDEFPKSITTVSTYGEPIGQIRGESSLPLRVTTSKSYLAIVVQVVNAGEIVFDGFQLEIGMENTDYEPYGRMPSEEFPSKIKCVGDCGEDGLYSVPISLRNENDDIQEELQIFLGAPLRKVNEICDYIDYANSCVVRNIKVLDDSGAKPIEESFEVLSEPIYEDIDLPKIVLPECKTVNFCVGTSVPADIELIYYQDINKKLARIEETIAKL